MRYAAGDLVFGSFNGAFLGHMHAVRYAPREYAAAGESLQEI